MKNNVNFAFMKRMLVSLLAVVVLVSSCGALWVSEYATPPSEQVVDIGYGKEIRGNLTSSVSSVDPNMEKTIYRNIYELIQGKCAGVMVNGTQITIRGENSINSSTEPLFIVNGAPQTSIDWINPNDVKSIDVLKDSATAIYGARGANGVIVITLK